VARLVSKGGSIAFHEIRLLQRFDSLLAVPLWEMTGDLILTAAQSALPHHDVSERLIEFFSEAGLPQPDVFCETPVGAVSTRRSTLGRPRLYRAFYHNSQKRGSCSVN
jgi:hypothetical protein